MVEKETEVNRVYHLIRKDVICMSMTAADWMERSYSKIRNQNAHDPECRMDDVINPVRPWAICADGTILSIQGSPCHYSCPKEFAPKYISVEVGLMKNTPIFDNDYLCEDTYFLPGQGVRYIYGNVAMEDVERFVSEHGGIVNI